MKELDKERKRQRERERERDREKGGWVVRKQSVQHQAPIRLLGRFSRPDCHHIACTRVRHPDRLGRH